ncbi:MAG: glutamine--fructose-6-phosphate transaminase (isomerizing) [Erysipelotrichaceae bacterium]|nr:glutamine--fructose-6-phosphate transaminase (isomerizing) [Erysipelotrichaceae bacterium]
MCGIIGYAGTADNAFSVLLDSLEFLEYRGYDSVGMAIGNREGLAVYKDKGRVNELRKKIENAGIKGNYGIGHTRWATHGGVNKANAHPHQAGKVTLVHNGIIENYQELIERYDLRKKLRSETDTEVVAHVLDHYYDGDALKAIGKMVKELKGTFSFAIIFADQPNAIYAIRTVSPIVMTKTADCSILASDLMSLSSFSNDYYVLPELSILKMTSSEIRVYDLSLNEIELQAKHIDWQVEALGKAGYPFYMEKEMMEEPKAVEDTIKERIRNGLPDFESDALSDEVFEKLHSIMIVACGTARHAGLVAKQLFERVAGIHTEVEYASEFIYNEPNLHQDTLLIAISQSGETIDTLEAIRYAKKQNIRTLAIINVKGSTMSQLVDYPLFTNAGPEIAVASTKAYTSQLSLLYLLVGRAAYVRGTRTKEEVESFISNLQRAPGLMNQVLECKDQIHQIAKEAIDDKSLFMIGRGLDYLSLMEGSLKLKEISYIHSESYASGELKHGPISLIEEGTPVVAAITQDHLVSKSLSNLKEVKARGARVYAFVKESLIGNLDKDIRIIELPNADSDFMVFPTALALQLYAYYVSMEKGYDVDKPRNLAKVVTVE